MTYPGQPYPGTPPQQFVQPQYAPPQYQQQPAAPMPAQPPQAYAPPVAPAPQYQQPAPAPGQFFTQQDPHTQAQMPPAPPQYQQPAMPSHPVDTSSFFGGAATISFAADKGYVKGTFRGGQVISKKIAPQTKMGTNEIITWQDGSPREQMVLTLQTAERADPQDDGQRQIFIKGDAVRACREALGSVKANDIEPGGWYYQAWVDEKAAKQAGYNPQKIFKVQYAPPGAPDPNPVAIAPPPPPAPPVPQPGQGVDQFAAYAAYQAQLAAQQPAPQAYAPQQAPQPPAYGQPQMPAQGSIAAMPQQHMAQFQQAAQHDPAVQAAIYGGQPAPQQFAPQPGGQPVQGVYGVPGQPPVAAPSTGAAPGEWSPFAPA